MSTYRDLFELSSRPEEVITMDEAVISRQEEIVRNYIITTKIESSFEKVFHSLTLDKGKGFWVQGAYGSGKSHFMSFLTVLLHYDEYWKHVPEKFQQNYLPIISDKKFLTVNFTLSEVNNLQVKIFDEIEKALHRDGLPIYIKNDKKIVNQFLSELDLMQKEKVFKIIENECEVSKNEWDKLVESFDVEKLAQIIIKYRQVMGSFSQKEYREVIYPHVKDGLEQIMGKVKDYYDGIVIFIDELSKFLQKKKKKSEEADALETIQALGQRVKNSPIWVVAAVQKNPATIIDESLYISKEEEKVFDRFEQIVLSEADIKEIIDKRIIKKDKNSRKLIGIVYKELKKQIPQLVNYVTQEKFIKLYPFHYEFINALIYLSTFGARHRVAVSECWKIVNNNLNKEAKELITIDMLYDIFRDTIIHDNFKQHYDIYENLFEDIISRPNFEYDRRLAKRLVKTLIINNILKKQPLNSVELTHRLMVNMGIGMELTLIYEEIYYTLREVYQKARGKGINLLEEDSDSDIVEHLWEVDPGSKGVKVEPEIIEEMKHINENDLGLAVQKFINSNEHLFTDYRTEWNSSIKMSLSFLWRNTERYGITTIKNIKRIKELPGIDTTRDDIDFALIIGFPFFATIKEKKDHIHSLLNKNPRIIYWLPSNLSENGKSKLTKLVAIKNLINKYDNIIDEETREKKLQLETNFNQLQEELNKKIEQCYLGGEIINKFKKEKNLAQFNTFQRLIEYMLSDIMDKLYPEHPRYNKKVTRMQSNKLIRDFIIPRAVKEKSNEIINVGEPLGIVEKSRSRYELQLKNKIFTKIYNVIEDGEWHGLDQIRKLIRNKPWGIQEIGLEIIIAALIANGECRACTKGGEILNSGNFNRNHVGGGKNLNKIIKSISKGNLVNNNIWQEILEIMELLDIEYPKSKNLINQNKIWANIIKKFSQLNEKANSTYKVLLELGGELQQFDKFNSSLSVIKEYLEFLDEVKNMQSIDDSYEGLIHFRKNILDNFSRISIFKDEHLRLQDIFTIVEERMDVKINAYFSYFNKIECEYEKVDDIISKFKNLGKIIIYPDKIKSFLQQDKKAKEDYQKYYIEEHKRYFGAYQKYLLKIKKLKEYYTLSLLEQIEKINVFPSLQKQMKQIKDNYLPLCSINLNITDLKEEPHCSCGFIPGDNFIPIDEEKVREQFRTSIKSYIEKLKKEEYKKQIEQYLAENPESRATDLLDIKSYDLDNVMEIVDNNFVLEINKALKSAYSIFIDPEKIFNMFKGSVHASEINKLGDKVSKYLKQQVKEKLVKEDEGIDLERVIILFSREDYENNEK